MSESSDSLAKAALEYRDKSLELVHEQAARIAELEAQVADMQQFWTTAMMAVRFYHELGAEFDCKAAMKSLAEAARAEEGSEDG